MNQVEKEIEIAGLIVKKELSGEMLTGEEERVFQEWLDESESHQAFYGQLLKGEAYQNFEETSLISDRREQWQHLDQLTRPRHRIAWRQWSACVAGIALLVSLGLWIGLRKEFENVSTGKMAVIAPGITQATLILDDGQEVFLKDRDTLMNTEYSDIKVQAGQVLYEEKVSTREEALMKYNTIVVPRGGIYSLILSDGTKVFLNSESELRYPVVFSGENREVSLKGEAFFEVTHHPEHPFIVQVGEMRTRVLGTTFNILAYADEPAIKTTLLSGRVEVSIHDNLVKEVLVPGMQASWERDTDDITVKEIDVNIQSLWRDGIIMLNDDGLESVMRMLARWYDVTCEFKGDPNVKHTFTGKIDRNEDLGSVLKTLTLLGGPRFEIVEKTVCIY